MLEIDLKMDNLQTQDISTQGTSISNVSSLAGSISVTALKALADPIRIKIIELLTSEQLCVCHLTQELDLAQPLISHHLKVLKEAGLISANRYRYWTYYYLNSQTIVDLSSVLSTLAASGSCSLTDIPKRPC